MAGYPVWSNKITRIPHVYIHVPFCSSKCHYCAFYSVPEADGLKKQAYLRAMADELCYYTDHYIVEPETIYIGGGNPALDLSLLSSLMEDIQNKISVSGIKEYTVEMNPVNVTPQLISILQKYGVTRVSLGIQTFTTKALDFAGRTRQTQRIVQNALDLLDTANIALSIDLISGLPYFDKATDIDTLAEIITVYHINHLSLYDLSIDGGSWFATHQFPSPEEEYIASYEKELYQLLETHGFIRYEISNWARHGKYAQHNLGYWRYQDFIGLGPSAHGKIQEYRITNAASIDQYMNHCCRTEIQLSHQELCEERLLMGLRLLNEGVSVAALEKVYPTFTKKTHRIITRYVERGELKFDGIVLQITPQGSLILNKILVDLFTALD